MSKKIILIFISVIIILGIFYYLLYELRQDSVVNTTDVTINGILVKSEWEKSSESYCAQGGDYFTLKTNSEELVLEFEPAYTAMQMSVLSGRNIAVTGEKKLKKIECPEGSQCPSTPDNIFICEVFKINRIDFPN